MAKRKPKTIAVRAMTPEQATEALGDPEGYRAVDALLKGEQPDSANQPALGVDGHQAALDGLARSLDDGIPV